MSKAKGFTLVEVLLSAGVLTLVLLGVIAVFAQTVGISSRIDYEYKAANIGKARIEFARAFIETRGFDALTADAFGEEDTRLDSAGVPDESGDFYRSTTVTVGYNGNVRLTAVEVTVGYALKGRIKDDAVTLDMVFADI